MRDEKRGGGECSGREATSLESEAEVCADVTRVWWAGRVDESGRMSRGMRLLMDIGGREGRHIVLEILYHRFPISRHDTLTAGTSCMQ